jgi:DhnA family fructose-bisphosphate aldolase class Ia
VSVTRNNEFNIALKHDVKSRIKQKRNSFHQSDANIISKSKTNSPFKPTFSMENITNKSWISKINCLESQDGTIHNVLTNLYDKYKKNMLQKSNHFTEHASLDHEECKVKMPEISKANNLGILME